MELRLSSFNSQLTKLTVPPKVRYDNQTYFSVSPDRDFNSPQKS